MKKSLVVLISALILLASLSVASATPYISGGQQVNFTADNSLYWAMIWDYTNGLKESDTGGYINVDSYLMYVCAMDVQVAYIYDVASGRYNEALALRDVAL